MSRARSSDTDREALLTCCREVYWEHREREMPEEREVRLAQRREYYRHWRAALNTKEHESSLLLERRRAYSTNSRSVDQGCVELPKFDHPDLIAKITEFHMQMDSLQSAKCEVCLEQFPNLRVDIHQCCRWCAADKHVPKLFFSSEQHESWSSATRTYCKLLYNNSICLIICWWTWRETSKWREIWHKLLSLNFHVLHWNK